MANTNIKKFIDQQNFMAKLFNKPVVHLEFLTVGAKSKLLDDLECALSPENLCCDGELRGAALQAKARYLNAAKRELMAMKAV